MLFRHVLKQTHAARIEVFGIVPLLFLAQFLASNSDSFKELEFLIQRGLGLTLGISLDTMNIEPDKDLFGDGFLDLLFLLQRALRRDIRLVVNHPMCELVDFQKGDLLFSHLKESRS